MPFEKNNKSKIRNFIFKKKITIYFYYRINLCEIYKIFFLIKIYNKRLNIFNDKFFMLSMNFFINTFKLFIKIIEKSTDASKNFFMFLKKE